MQFICNGIILLFCSYFHKQDVYECVDCKFINIQLRLSSIFLSAVFLFFFLPVSCQAFLASRKQEYGVMFSLGMSRKEAFRNLLFENVIISVLALAIALAAGTVLSFLFFPLSFMQ